MGVWGNKKQETGREALPQPEQIDRTGQIPSGPCFTGAPYFSSSQCRMMAAK
jgi:hypothetical protein